MKLLPCCPRPSRVAVVVILMLLVVIFMPARSKGANVNSNAKKEEHGAGALSEEQEQKQEPEGTARERRQQSLSSSSSVHQAAVIQYRYDHPNKKNTNLVSRKEDPDIKTDTEFACWFVDDDDATSLSSSADSVGGFTSSTTIFGAYHGYTTITVLGEDSYSSTSITTSTTSATRKREPATLRLVGQTGRMLLNMMMIKTTPPAGLSEGTRVRYETTSAAFVLWDKQHFLSTTTAAQQTFILDDNDSSYISMNFFVIDKIDNTDDSDSDSGGYYRVVIRTGSGSNKQYYISDQNLRARKTVVANAGTYLWAPYNPAQSEGKDFAFIPPDASFVSMKSFRDVTAVGFLAIAKISHTITIRRAGSPTLDSGGAAARIILNDQGFNATLVIASSDINIAPSPTPIPTSTPRKDNDDDDTESPPTKTSSPSPNMIFIVLDDMSINDLDKEIMPRLDSLLRKQGMTFNRAFTADPRCGPSRGSIIRGQYSHSHGYSAHTTAKFTNATWQKFGYNRFNDELGNNSLPVWIKNGNNRYKTYLVGKSHWGGNRDRNYIPQKRNGDSPQGWTRSHLYATSYQNPKKTIYEDNVYIETIQYIDPDDSMNNESAVDDTYYRTDLELASSIEFMNEAVNAGDPFFLYLAPFAPHAKRQDNQVIYADRHKHMFEDHTIEEYPPSYNEDDITDKSYDMQNVEKLSIRDHDKFVLSQIRRWRSLVAVDEMIESIVQYLQTNIDKTRGTQLIDDTYIFFTSDHGFMQGEHRLIEKTEPYYESVTVPFIVRGPNIAPDSESNLLVSLVDIASTLTEIANVEAPADVVEGRSILPILHGDITSSNDWRQFLFTEHHAIFPKPPYLRDFIGIITDTSADRSTGNGSAGQQQEQYHYIHWGNGQRELYDLKTDTYELDSGYTMKSTVDPNSLVMYDKMVQHFFSSHANEISNLCWITQPQTGSRYNTNTNIHIRWEAPSIGYTGRFDLYLETHNGSIRPRKKTNISTQDKSATIVINNPGVYRVIARDDIHSMIRYSGWFVVGEAQPYQVDYFTFQDGTTGSVIATASDDTSIKVRWNTTGTISKRLGIRILNENINHDIISDHLPSMGTLNIPVTVDWNPTTPTGGSYDSIFVYGINTIEIYPIADLSLSQTIHLVVVEKESQIDQHQGTIYGDDNVMITRSYSDKHDRRVAVQWNSNRQSIYTVEATTMQDDDNNNDIIWSNLGGSDKFNGTTTAITTIFHHHSVTPILQLEEEPSDEKEDIQFRVLMEK